MIKDGSDLFSFGGGNAVQSLSNLVASLRSYGIPSTHSKFCRDTWLEAQVEGKMLDQQALVITVIMGFMSALLGVLFLLMPHLTRQDLLGSP